MDSIQIDWDHAALAYELFNNSEDSYSYNIEWPCIRDMLPPLRDKAVLDLGCGTGIFTFLLEQYAPAALIGMDLSEEMLKIAKAKAAERRSRAQFLQGDAANATSYPHGQFDLVFSSTMTHYLPDLPELFQNVHDCLKPGGTAVFSVIHPVYSAMYPIGHGNTFPADDEWAVRYLDRRQRAYIQPWIEYNEEYENYLSRSCHHTFGDYLNAIIHAGLSIADIQEPLPPDSWKETCPERYDSFVETPTYLILKITKP